jgi:hypothetical protein
MRWIPGNGSEASVNSRVQELQALKEERSLLFPNRARARYRPRYRALTVAGQKRFAASERERRLRRMLFAEIQGIDNEHDLGCKPGPESKPVYNSG